MPSSFPIGNLSYTQKIRLPDICQKRGWPKIEEGQKFNTTYTSLSLPWTWHSSLLACLSKVVMWCSENEVVQGKSARDVLKWHSSTYAVQVKFK